MADAARSSARAGLIDPGAGALTGAAPAGPRVPRTGEPAPAGGRETGRVSALGLLLVGLVIAVGVVGTVLPLVPGLPLAWAAVLAWAVLEGGGPGRWLVVLVAGVVALAGVAAKYALSSRSLTASGAPTSTVALAAASAVVGFFVVPVLGALVGLAVGAFAAEYLRLGDVTAAWRSTRGVLLALGVGALLELLAGVVVAAVWLVGVVAT